MSESLLLTKCEAAMVLGISTSTLREAIRAGQVPTVPLGKRQMIPRAALLRLAGALGGHK
jgi:excisionase family DNA binding protein